MDLSVRMRKTGLRVRADTTSFRQSSPVAEEYEAMALSQATTDINKARLKTALPLHSGDWLSAPPITLVDLRLSDEEVRVAVAHRLGCRA